MRCAEARRWGLWLTAMQEQMCFPYPGFCHQHVVPEDGGPTTRELADVGDHHNGQRGSLKDDKDLETIRITEISPADLCVASKLSKGWFVNLHVFYICTLKM